MENPQAFPTDFDAILRTAALYGGMSLRDYFAAQALSSLIRNWHGFGEGDAKLGNLPGMSKAAYMFADAMLAERVK